MEGKEKSEGKQVLVEESMAKDVVPVGVGRAGMHRDTLAPALATYILSEVAVGKAHNTTRLDSTAHKHMHLPSL